MKRPLLTVCVITYNHAKYIEQALDSILEQRVTCSWQIIIADDCSTDGTRQILERYQEQHPDLIHLLLRDVNVGPEQNWLDLMAHARSRYVLYAEGDDYFCDPDKLQLQVDFLETHPEVAVCFHPVKVVYEDGSQPDDIFPTPAQRKNKKTLNLSDLLVSNFIQTNSVMYRWRFGQGDIKQTFPLGVAPGDWFLHLLHAEHGKIALIDRVMAVYRKHPAGLWWDSQRNQDAFWSKHGLAYMKLFRAMAERYATNERDRNVIDENSFNILRALLGSKDVNAGHVFSEIVATYPDVASSFYSSQQKRIVDLQKRLSLVTDDRDYREDMVNAREFQIRELEEKIESYEKEFTAIKISRVAKSTLLKANIKNKLRRRSS